MNSCIIFGLCSKSLGKFLLWMDVCDIFFLVVDGFGYRYIFLFYYDFDKFWKRKCKYLGDVYV